MMPARAYSFLAGVVLIGLLGVTACQTPTDVVRPSQAVGVNQTVSVSDWIAINANTWSVSPKAPQMHIAGFVDSAVTNAVVENGLVVAFYRHSASDHIFPLPVTLGNQSISFTYYAMNDKGIISFQQKPGQIIDGEYRWIVVPKEAAKHVDWTNYEVVRQELALEE
ncbi:hypothetical protein M0L20_20025 [Spirosoma sp. RP8]|uniref:Uncharacterized protein n=1 Tax=Spirosoma liriopis TaxID=2937440 RepID=A0ABT0HPS0_9BACT|nr:hypothetical protein [Spirosoma liriopis]MCK8494164.1 hypothetical protein [Spirosoma liriopis]